MARGIARRFKTPEKKSTLRVPAAKLEEMVEEAVIDAYGDDEQRVGLASVIEDNLSVPFETQVLGVDVKVVKITQNRLGEIVAICTRGKYKQVIPVSELPLPDPPPEGWEWIEAYRYWAGER